MNNRPFTVYFDTCFFIWLATATDAEFGRVARVMNERGIRYVQSDYIILELLSGGNRIEQDRSLVSRIRQIEIAPFYIPAGYKNDGDCIPWDVLLLDQDDRETISGDLKCIFDRETIARSFSNVAQRNLTPEEDLEVQEVLRPFLSELGISNDSNDVEKQKAFLGFYRTLISELSNDLPSETFEKLDKLIQTDPLTYYSSADLLQLSDDLKNALGDPIVAAIKQEDSLLKSTLALEDRPFRTVTGNSSNKEIKRLGNTIRDAGHMNLFVSYADQIDILQVDSSQYSLIQRKKPRHFITNLGLAERCFSASTLEQALVYVVDYEGKRV